MTVAVTGATGFIGRHVVAELERRGIGLTLVSRKGTSTLMASSPHRVVTMDIAAAPADAYNILGRPDVLIHLAWGNLGDFRAPVHLEREFPVHAAFLEGLVTAGLPRLTVSGTCLEYGMQSGALSEALPTAPTTPYGRAKDQLRRYLEQLRDVSPFKLTWARLFYLHGTGQAASSLLPQLEAAINRGDATFDMSGGEQLRDYLPVTSAAAHIVELALNDRDNGVVNVCSGQPVSIRSLVESFVASRNSTIELNLGRYPYLDYEPMAFWGDRQKLDRSIGRA